MTMTRRCAAAAVFLLLVGGAAAACSGGPTASTGAAVLPDGGQPELEAGQPDARPTNGPPDAEVFGPLCNGRPWLCDRTYDRVTYLTTHGAVTNDDPAWQGGRTQHRTLREQLDRGVRAVMLEAHAGSPVAACLGSCARGSAPLATSLAAIKAFLDVNPREIVTLLLDDVDAPVADVVSAIGAAGLDTLAYEHAAGSPWPTLGAMITSGKRLVVLARDLRGDADAGAPPSWYHGLLEQARETNRTSATVQDLLRCDLTLGDAGARPLTLVHEYLVVSGDSGNAPAPESAATQVNALSTLTSTRSRCREQGADVTFLAVDFFETGDARNFVTAIDDADAGP